MTDAEKRLAKAEARLDAAKDTLKAAQAHLEICRREVMAADRAVIEEQIRAERTP